MVCYVGKLLAQAAMNNPTIVVVTNRNDLDGQLFNTFSLATETLNQVPIQTGDRDDLRNILASRQAGGIIFTTIQKFALLSGETKHPALNQRHNIVVISYEAHRSQYDDKARQQNRKLPFRLFQASTRYFAPSHLYWFYRNPHRCHR